MDTSAENLFDDYFDTINLNDELKSFYEFLNDDELNESFENATLLTELINENYKRYNDINLSNIENLSEDFEAIINEIKKIYRFIAPETLLNSDLEEAEKTKKILDLLYNYLNQLNNMIKIELDSLEIENNSRQEKIKQINYSNVDKKVLEEILNKYNDIVIYNSIIEENLFDNFRRQIRRRNDLNKLYRLINIEIDDISEKISEKDKLNIEITKEIKNTNDKILYLEDLMMEKSKYENEFLAFKNYFNSLIAYDDTDFTDLTRLYYSLCENLKIKSLLSYFEDSFIKEREDSRREEKFIYDKYGIKNIKTSLDYISANYMDFINSDEKQLINVLYEKVDKEHNIEELYERLKRLVTNIWKRSLTNIYSFNQNNDFCFICTNNQFIDEKHESILITKKMLERVEDYFDYQIGFICDFNDNILYITENSDIMTVDYNDMSNLKTPKQLEQEFLNFKVCNRIALNGFITKLSGVYFINDGDSTKYKKAVELANQYNLPLITLKKDKN